MELEEQAKKALEVLEKASQARSDACLKEIGKILEKFNCEIQPQVIITNRSVSAGIVINPLPEKVKER